MDSPPQVSRAWRSLSAMSPSASSHSTRLNAPLPLAPTRTAGCSRRSSPYTRSPKRRTLAQMYAFVTSLAVPPSMAVMRPPRSVTRSVQASGQSSGHAVSTRDSGGATPGRMAIPRSYRVSGPRRPALLLRRRAGAHAGAVLQLAKHLERAGDDLGAFGDALHLDVEAADDAGRHRHE